MNTTIKIGDYVQLKKEYQWIINDVRTIKKFRKNSFLNELLEPHLVKDIEHCSFRSRDNICRQCPGGILIDLQNKKGICFYLLEKVSREWDE